ncbi:LpqB family beta-propeller domain-containing protein [Rhodococcus sp. IEGM 1379]|uniref:LpqB family beta-propeller domain-containing protein n=1 Tax=Rhodococcus sp. IEGM 1379 TaxID=3047086 RepID=UPI0024B81959|nr:LpqB family beta-propeller domain-containing protein [Rhodococcus sp. IEGM 1379]MDI9914493.1 LpqB family beta-propeller domain-containing protein [Rhodococcus sp. IEGM 1379]
MNGAHVCSLALVLAFAPIASPGAASANSENLGAEKFSVRCTPTDTGLEELSGLLWTENSGYAVGDHGSDDRIALLDSQCQVSQWIDIGVETIDVEDLAQDDTGVLWLADTGDNNMNRELVTLIGLNPETGQTTTVPLRLPDAPHDIEAFALTPSGTPVLVTKTKDGSAQIFTTPHATVHTLSRDEPTTLASAGAVSVPGDDARPITGAAVSADGTSAALRTKKEVYIYRIEDRDVAAAFSSPPASTITVPEQPQGEAVAFTHSGDLLVASEADGGALPSIHQLDAEMLPARPAESDRSFETIVAIFILVLIVAGVFVYRTFKARN